MTMNASRRNFIRGLAGTSLFAIGGCKCPFGSQKIKLAAVGVLGKGFSDWAQMLKSGLVEMVAFCDCDYTAREEAQRKLAKEGVDFDMYAVPFYTDYRRLLDDAGMLGVEAMTISTPDHLHAAIAIGAMRQGIHVYVQKPLVRTLWELDRFDKTAREYGVITQMGNQGSSLSSMRRCTEVIQSGILGEVREVHVWTNRPVWPQGAGVARWVKDHPKGDAVRDGLNWDAWLGPAEYRPFLDRYPDGIEGIFDPWELGKNVYHRFTWRGFFDFGCGAFGDMACHTMNLPFRGLELGGVSSAECVKIESANDIAYPVKSTVKLQYKERLSRVQKNADGTPRMLPPVTLFWYDGYDPKSTGKTVLSGNRPSAEIMPKVVKSFGDVPNTGCYIIGSKGAVLMRDDYGAKCALALNDDKAFVDIFQHPAANQVGELIPKRAETTATPGKSTVEMKGFAKGHYIEFLDAIRGEGPVYTQTHSRCFSDIEYAIPQMEGILIGCIAQRVPGRLDWCACSHSFPHSEAANALVRPFVRTGWEIA